MYSLFTYGTLQNETVQIKLFGRLLKGHRDQVRGYKIIQLVLENETGSRQKAYPAAVPGDDAVDIISGMVYILTETELKIADLYETAAYHRVLTRLISGRTAWIYLNS